MNAKFVAGTLLRLFGERGAPKFVRSDSGQTVRRVLKKTRSSRG